MFAVGISLGFSSTYIAVAPLGTSNSTSGIVLEKSSLPSINIVANSAGHRKTHPCCAFTDSGELLFGDTAHDYYVRNPDKVIPSIFAYAALDNIKTGSSTEGDEIKGNFRRMVERTLSVKYKGHRAFVEEGGSLRPMKVDTESNSEESHSDVTANSLFIQYLNHLKEHSVDGPCSLKRGDQKTRTIFLTLSVPRYAFPTLATQGDGAYKWVIRAVMDSEFQTVVSHVHILFSDEAALLGTDFLITKRGNPSVEEQPLLLPLKAVTKPCSMESSHETSDRNILVVDWGAQGLNFTKFRSIDGMLVGNSSQTPFFSTLFSLSSPVLGGDSMDVTLSDRVALTFIQQQRRLFSSQIPQLSTALLSQRDILGKMNPMVKEHIPPRAMRRLRLRMEERKSSLLSNPQAIAVPVEVEAFYEGMDLLDSKTLSRHKVESAMENEWGLIESFSKALKEFLTAKKNTAVPSETPYSDSGEEVQRVVLCGGMCQNSSFTTALQKSIFSVLCAHFPEVNNGGTSGGIEVTPVSKLDGNVSSEEIFAVGGCLHSYLSGTVKLNSDLSQKNVPRNVSSTKAHRPSKKEIQRAMMRACSNVLDRGTKCDPVEKLSSSLAVHFLLQNIYLFTCSDTNILANHSDPQNGLRLPCQFLTRIFSQATAFPCRVLLKWPKEAASVVLFFFFSTAQKEIESIETKNNNSTQSELDLISCYAVSPTGIPLRKPSLPPTRLAFIEIGVLLEEEQPILQIQVVSKKMLPLANDNDSNSVNSDSKGKTTIIDSNRVHSSVNVPLPCFSAAKN